MLKNRLEILIVFIVVFMIAITRDTLLRNPIRRPLGLLRLLRGL
jgi:hypothetical protein